MGKSQQISENEKWQAVISSDRSYDGKFFYGVRTTGIFCRPSCRAKAPLRENVQYFNEAADALREGFRPCKRCRPDMKLYDPDQELVNTAKVMLEDGYAGNVSLEDIAKALGVSSGHLTRLFRRKFNKTPERYLVELRVEKAIELLCDTDGKVLEIAYASGFKSPSSFYRCFREQTGQKPGEHRKNGGGVQCL